MNDKVDPDGRPMVQLLYDEIWEAINKFGLSGMTNAEAVGVLEMVKHDQLEQMNENR